MKSVAILGYARQGRSAYDYWSKLGWDVTIHDMNPSIKVPEDAKFINGEDYLKDLDRYDLLVRTPRLHPSQILENNPTVGPKITTVTNEFMRIVDTPIIGITGTKGKGTTTLLIDAILKAGGKNTVVGGNIGIPPFDIVDLARDADYVVLELSNFQTIDLNHSPQIAVCLKMAPEHLDWHKDYAEYVESKKQMFANQTVDDTAIFYLANTQGHVCVGPDELNKHVESHEYDHDSEYIASGSVAALKLGYQVPAPDGASNPEAFVAVSGQNITILGQPLLSVDDVKLLGRHNLQNVCAAIAATFSLIDGDTEAIKRALADCTGFEHRLEVVATKDDVAYINDSFASAPEATIAAIEALSDKPYNLIAGGFDKGSDYSDLIRVIASSNIQNLIAIGDTGPKIAYAVANFKPDLAWQDGGDNMTDIVNKAASVSRPGDTVLMSTASASFGLFKDFFDRGDQFKEAVSRL